MTNIHIHAPQPNEKYIVLCEKCGDCGKRTRMIVFYTEWYGIDATCIKCGREWQDGEWQPLAFGRSKIPIRQQNIDAAKRLYRNLE